MFADTLTRVAPGWLAPGRRVYAVGDVHGCDERLAAMHRAIAADLQASPAGEPLLVHLGDYIDRGPDSAGVVRRLARREGPCPAVNLRGNHDQMLLDALGGAMDAAALWLHNKGESALRSWGTTAAAGIAAWQRAIAPELPFLRTLAWTHVVDGYVFVHAGLRPGVALARQARHDLLWIREGFLDHPGAAVAGLAVVHGHTPVEAPEVTPWRIGVDTGAVVGGPLSCAVLEGRGVRFLTA